MPSFEKLKDKLKKDIVSSFISEGLSLGESKAVINDIRDSLVAISFESMRENEKENLNKYADQLRLKALV